MAISHSFTAEYTCCFEQDFKPLDIICECSYEGRTPLHIIFDCPLFQRARDKACIDNDCFHPTIYNLSAPPKEPCACSNSWNMPQPHTNHHAALGCPASLVLIPIQTDGIGMTILRDELFVPDCISPELHQQATAQLVSFHKGPGTGSKVSLYRMCDCCHGRVGTLIFILSYLRTRDPERILPYIDRGTFVF